MLEDAATTPLPDVETPKGGCQEPGRCSLRQHDHAKHQIQFLKKAVRQLGTRALAGRTRLARTLLDLREAIVSDLGGKENLSQAKMILVDDVARLTLWIDSNRRMTFDPAVRGQQAEADPRPGRA